MPCPHEDKKITTESSFPDIPRGEEYHTYYIHKNGDVFRETEPAHNQDNVCDEDRLTLIHLSDDKIVHLETPEKDRHRRLPWPNRVTVPDVPQYIINKLKNICMHCDCKMDILWRNFHRAESHFDACFRYHDDADKNPTNKCFLKLYTLRVPFIARKEVTLSIVHHIRAQGESFVSANGGNGPNKEHMFGLIAGFDDFDLNELLTRHGPRWWDVATDHLKASAGLTPKLFLATVINYYGFYTCQEIVRSGRELKGYDDDLQDALDDLGILPSDSWKLIKADTDRIQKLNKDLIKMNRCLTGTRSIMHYLAASAGILIDRISAFEVYVTKRLEEWTENPKRKELIKSLSDMDFCQETLRDQDKLEMVQKNMQQYMVDIDAFHTHIDINVSMVRNLISEQDRAFQTRMLTHANTDSFNMKVIAILTVLFLPGTFMAVFLTTPMFNWDKPEEPVIRHLPTEIYWATSVSVTATFAILLELIANPKWVTGLVDKTPERVKRYLQDRDFYRRASNEIVRNNVEREEKIKTIERQNSDRAKEVEENSKKTIHQASTSTISQTPQKDYSPARLEEARYTLPRS